MNILTINFFMKTDNTDKCLTRWMAHYIPKDSPEAIEAILRVSWILCLKGS